MKRPILKRKPKMHGQSFIELMLVLLILALMLTGVVEFGFLLNAYLHVLDGAREGARFGSNGIPFDKSTGTLITGFWADVVKRSLDVTDPVILNPGRQDDIVISVVSVTHNSSSYVRFPNTDDGWSMCGNYAAITAFYTANSIPFPTALAQPGWGTCTVQKSKFTTADIGARVDSMALSSGILLVEIYYNYPQVLKMPIFVNSLYSVVPDPIPIYLYTMMPIAAAEPTPTP